VILMYVVSQFENKCRGIDDELVSLSPGGPFLRSSYQDLHLVSSCYTTAMAAICSSCGQVNLNEARFCSTCGHAIAAQAASVASASPTVFVGRQRELQALRAHLDTAFAGVGSLVMLVGEAGIGKTSTARAFAAFVRQRGLMVLWGSCFEGDWSPPYGPWVEALGEYARTCSPERLQRELGPGGPSLVQLIPQLRAILPDTPLPAPLSPDEERLRLYEAVGQFFLTITKDQPAVLVLDDLHWADQDSLRLLRYIARFVSRSRLVIVGTYREPDLEVQRQPFLSEVLAVLRRETDYQRITIHGLAEDEIAAYLDQGGQQHLPQALVRAIYAETNGNPFYTREIFRHLVEEEKIIPRAGRWSTDLSVSDLGIPEGVRQVLDRRVSRLSQETQRLLRFASAFTGGFTFQLLQALTGLPEETLLNSLDEALQGGLIRTTGEAATYDFAHAIVRHTLYNELNPDRRARLHRRIALALEGIYAGCEMDYAAEFAVQYHASSILPGAERGIPYCLAAAEQARAGYAHDRAVVFLRMARDLLPGGPSEASADLLCQLAIAEAEALLLDDAHRSTEEALAALTASGTEPKTIASFLVTVARALKDGGAPHALWEPLVERGLALVGDERDLLWARLTLLRDWTEAIATGTINAGRWRGCDPQAVAIARASGDEDDHARTLEPYDWRTRQETDEVLALARTWQPPAAIMRALNVVARDLAFRHGAFREAAERFEELLVTSRHYGSIPGQAEALLQLSACQLVLGEVALAQHTAQRVREMVARLGSMHRLRVVIEVGLVTGFAYYVDGDWPDLATVATQFVASPEAARSPLGLFVAANAANNHSLAGNLAEARRILRALLAVLPALPPTMYVHNGTVNIAATAVWELGAVEWATTCRQLALDLIAAGIGGHFMGSHELTVARMAALLGDMAEAGAYFARARTELEASGRRPLRAIVEYDEAVALLRTHSTDHARISLLLDAALEQFRTLGMEAWLKRTLEQLALRRRPTSSEQRVYPDGLTAREVEVLRLLAEGKTNKEIAVALVVSVPTVQRHIANIYGKIDARGRADATAYAISRGLTPTRLR
jgi:DNA-binding CsgD family transcriptional regulator